MTTVQDFLNKTIKLPSPPAVALKILEAVRQDECSFDDLAQIITADPALTIRILKIANSSLFGFPNPVESLSQATAMIGTNALKNIALSFVIVQDNQDVPEGNFDLNLFWRRAITAAVAADTLIEYVKLQDRDIFVSALLQDIGVLILYLADPVAYGALQDDRRVNHTSICKAEQQQFDFDHTEVSHHLLTTWGLPESICQTIRLHHSDVKDDTYGESAMILQLADKISALYHGKNSNRLSIEIHDSLEKLYKLSVEEADELIDIVGNKAHDLLELFQIDPGDIKPFSAIMQEANEELSRLNFSYAQIVLELKQAKQNAEQLAIELKLANENLRQLAFRDGLTGLYNHRYFQEILQAEIERSERYEHPMSLLLIDIDFFKKVNDKFGHPAGDYVLKEVSEMLTKLVRRIDIVARYGGEEFSIILPETALTGGKILGQRIRRGIEQMEIQFEGQSIPVTISCGLANNDFANKKTTRSELIKWSDKALYEAKKNGRNRLEF
ncbi:MAG: GGDEF domain-containing protein [Thermodesulfobacteriota bacterium]|nr:GGDEF domain-containing protein [Thermodesulfobacteriota bacterium]